MIDPKGRWIDLIRLAKLDPARSTSVRPWRSVLHLWQPDGLISMQRSLQALTYCSSDPNLSTPLPLYQQLGIGPEGGNPA